MTGALTADLRQRKLISDENPLIVIVILFVVWAASQLALDRAIQRCYTKGGYPEVESWLFGSVWKLKCLK